MKRTILVSLLLTACATTENNNTVTLSKPSDGGINQAISVAGLNTKKCILPKNIENEDWRDLAEISNSCVSAKNWPLVETIGTVLAERYTQLPWGPFYLSLAAEGRNDLERAIWMSDLAMKRSPDIGLLHFQKGRVLWSRGEHKLGLESLHRSIQLNTNLIDAHLFLGQIFFRDQDFSKAARHFQAVLRVRPTDPTALMGLSECHIQSGDARSALEWIQKGKNYYSNEPMFIVREAFIYETMIKDYERALKTYREIQDKHEKKYFVRSLDFSVTAKIRDLEMSTRSQRSLAGSQDVEVK